MGFGSSFKAAVSSVVSKPISVVTNTVQKAGSVAEKVGTTTRDVVNSPVGSAALPFAAVLTPTGRSNLAGFAAQALPIAGNIVAPGAGGAAGNAAGTILDGYFGDQPPLPTVYGSPQPSQQDTYAAQYGGGAASGATAAAPYYQPSTGTPGWVWAVVAGVAALFAILLMRR